MVFLELLFGRFCDYVDGKLGWTEDSKWTELVFGFFHDENTNPAETTVPFVEVREHMNIDYIWRYDSTKYSTNDIELAVESENQENRVDVLIENEVQNLVDLRARNKVAIFYPNLGDENVLLDKIRKAIKRVSEQCRFEEKYVFVLGFATRKEGKKAILWKGYFLDKTGEVTSMKERVTFQRQM